MHVPPYTVYARTGTGTLLTNTLQLANNHHHQLITGTPDSSEPGLRSKLRQAQFRLRPGGKTHTESDNLTFFPKGGEEEEE